MADEPKEEPKKEEPKKEEPKPKKEEKEVIPSWGQKLMEQVKALTEDKKEDVQKVPVPPVPKVEEPLEEPPLETPQEQPQEKPQKKRSFLDWLM